MSARKDSGLRTRGEADRAADRRSRSYAPRMTLDQLPDDLPVPVDDGGADHLVGMKLPDGAYPTAQGGEIDLRSAGSPWLVIYVYPMTGRPDVDLPDDWEMIPGARGCTPQTCAFRDHQADLDALGAMVVGLSVQTAEYQAEMVERLHVPFPIVSDADRRFGDAMRLPTFEAAGMTLYRRLTMLARAGAIEHVMYPVFPPDRNAQDVIDWLKQARPRA